MNQERLSIQSRTNRAAAVRRKAEIAREINYVCGLMPKMLIGVVPIVDAHLAILRAEFNDLERYFPTRNRR